MTKHRIIPVLLFLILAIGAGLRLYGLGWDDGLRGYPHPDERHLANTMTHISVPSPIDWKLLNDPDHSPLNPRRLIPGSQDEHYDLAYGTLPVYLYRATAVVLAYLTGRPELDTYDAYRLIGRSVTALFSLLTVLWVYRIGRRTFGVPAALLGMALLAVCVLHIQLSHFMTVDLLMSAMITAGLLFAVRFAQGGRTIDALAMGLLLGLSMASKFNGITLGAGIAAAYGIAWLGGKRRLGDLLAYCVPLTLIGWSLAFGLFEYYAIRDPYTYAQTIGIQAEMVSGKTDWPYTRQYVNTAPYLFQLRNLVAWGMGWPLGIASVAGAILSLAGLAINLWQTRICAFLARFVRVRRRGEQSRASETLAGQPGSTADPPEERWLAHPRRAGMLVLLGWAVPFFAYTARLEVKFLRYMLPLTPVLCLLAADLLWRLGNWLAGIRSRAQQQGTFGSYFLRGAPAALVLVPSALWALAYMRVYAQEHPWQAASRWFYQHAPRGSVYTWEAWGDPIPTDLPGEDLFRQEYGYRDVWMHPYHDTLPAEKLQDIADSLRQANYVVLSTPRIYLSVSRLPWRYPIEIRYYELLFTGQLGYELVAKFTAFPGLGPFQIDDLGADQSFFDYEHPLVLIFQKTRDLSDKEWVSLFIDQLKAEPRITRKGNIPPVQLPIPRL